jgi:mono/diheme cytochrome c family protein
MKYTRAGASTQGNHDGSLLLAISEYDGSVNRTPLALAALALLAFGCGCGDDRSSRTNTELGLNAQQASGRYMYQQICAPCHDAHSVPGQNGPSLKGLFKKTFLPSGLPANERFVRQTILNGRNMMPAAGSGLTQQQLDDLLAYLHTL